MSYGGLIVDFGGVLTTPLQDSMVAFSEAAGIEFQDLLRVTLKAYMGEGDPLVVDFETGRLEESEFSLKFAERITRATGVEIDPERLVQRLFGALRLDEGMFDAVAAIRRAGKKTALLSNSWGVSSYPRERLEEVMDVIVISGEVGIRKPDPQIFAHTTEELGLSADQCVFVDDHPGHLEVAQEIGLTTVLHRDAAQSIEELERLFDVKVTV